MCEAPVQCLVCRHRALRLRPPPRSAFQAESALSARGRERAAALRRCFSPSGSCSTAGSRKTWQGTAFGFARGRRPNPSRRSGLASRQARVDAALEPAPAGRGLEGFPPPGPWRDNRRATRHPGGGLARPGPTAGSARKRLRARTGNGPGSKREARNQKRRGAGPCRIRRSGPSLAFRYGSREPPGARGHRHAPRAPLRGSRGSRSLTVRPLCPRAPRGIWRVCLRPGSPNGGRDRD